MKIQQQITKNGLTFNQLNREGKVAIYQQTKGNTTCYEVIIIQEITKPYTLPTGKVVEPGEYYPSSGKWGSAGWTSPWQRPRRSLTNSLPVTRRP